MKTADPTFSFGPFRLDPDDEVVWEGSERLDLKPKAFAVLRYLVERPQQLVRKQDLLDTLWPETAVGDAVLKNCIAQIRQVLGDQADDPTLIETVHGRGYRFLGTSSAIPDAIPHQIVEPNRKRSYAKISPPTLPNSISRNRLLDLFDEALMPSQRVLWVAAPPGYGKTTLAAQYMASRALPSLWYQLHESDADPGTVCHYLTQACHALPSAGLLALPRFTPEALLNFGTFARGFFEHLFTYLPSQTILVFDNYHDVPPDSLFHTFIAEGLQAVPPESFIVVLSRQPPPPCLARLSAEQKLGVIDGVRLKFTLEETHALVKLHQSTKAIPEEPEFITQLHSQTDGWAAGLILCLQHDHPRSPLKPEQIVFDYLATETLERQQSSVRQLLLQTALFSSFTESMARDISQQSDPARILRQLIKDQYFLECRQGLELEYQYHPLFRNFLLLYGHEHIEHDLYVQWHRGAASILEKADRLEAATDLWFHLKDWESVNRLLVAQAPALIQQGRSLLLAEWIEKIPCEQFAIFPWLGYWLAKCSAYQTPTTSIEQFEDVFNIFQAQADAEGTLTTACSAIEAIIFSYAQYQQLDVWIERIDSSLTTSSPSPNPAREALSLFSLLSAFTWRCHANPRVEQLANQAYALFKTQEDLPFRIPLGLQLYNYFSWHNGVLAGEEIATSLFAMRETQNMSPLELILITHLEALHCWWTGNSAQCFQAVLDGQALCSTHHLPALDLLFPGQGVAGALIQQDIPRAEKFLQQLTHHTTNFSGLREAHYHQLSGWIALTEQRLNDALYHASLAVNIADAQGQPFFQGLMHILLAQIAVATNTPSLIKTSLQQISAIAHEHQLQVIEYGGLVVEAGWQLEQGVLKNCDVLLQQVFDLSQSTGLTVVMGLDLNRLKNLCYRAFDKGIAREQAQHFVSTLNFSRSNPLEISSTN